MRFIQKGSNERINTPVFVIFISMILLGITFFDSPYSVNAEDTEPVLNFYVERELVGHYDDISALEWSHNGLWIASGSLDNSTKIWSTSTWNVVRTINYQAQVNELSWSKSTQRLAISYGNGTIDIYSSVGWNLIQNLSQHMDDVNALDWNPTGSALSSGDNTGTIEIWDTSSWNSIKTLGMPSGIYDLKWSNDGNKLAACSEEGTIKVWDTTTWAELRSFDVTSGSEATESLAWSYDDSKLASSSGDNIVKVWDATSWNVIQNKDVESPMKIDWGSDGSYIGVGTIGGIKIWDTTSWEEILIKETPGNSQVTTHSINPEGDRIASGSPSDENNTVLIWEKNLSPILDPIGNINTLEDEPFTYTVTATDDDPVIFSGDSTLFDVDPDSGQISFTPTNSDVGEHEITITVNDGKGGVDSETFIFTVINVDDPPQPFFNWHYGTDYVNITLRVGGQIGNSVKLQVKENDIQIDEIIVERVGGFSDERNLHLDMNTTGSYDLTLLFSGNSGENTVAVTLERGGIAYTEHLLFDSELGADQIIDIDFKDLFASMGLVVFDASESMDVDSDIVEYLWDFGDGLVGEDICAVHIYPENGIYNVSLIVESDNGVNRSLIKYISLMNIPNQEDLDSILSEDSTIKYLESTNQIAVILDGLSHLKIQDSKGRITGFDGNNYVSEIEEVHLMYHNYFTELYHIPKGTEFTLNIGENEKNYTLDIIISDQGSKRIIVLDGLSGQISLKIGEDGNSFSIFTENMYNEYSLRINVESTVKDEAFEIKSVNITSLNVHYYYIYNWESITSDKAITLGIDDDNDGKIDISIDLENGMTGEEIEVIIMNKGKSSSPFFSPSMILLIVGFISIAGFGCLIGSTEVGKLALISLILPLYTRIKKEQVLDNEIRGMIRGYVIANPGDNYNSIKRALGLNNGALAYHLKVLEKARVIKSRQNGMYKRFYPSEMKIPKENGSEISEIQRILLLKISETPGINQKEIAKLLGLSKGVINYHVKVLYGKQLLKMEKRGRKTLCYINTDVVREIKSKNEEK